MGKKKSKCIIEKLLPPVGLSQHTSQYTIEQRDSVIEWLARTQTLEQLRSRQDITSSQSSSAYRLLEAAYKDGDRVEIEKLTLIYDDLDARFLQTTAAIDRRVFDLKLENPTGEKPWL